MLVAGSHGSGIAAYLGATAGAHALVLNDAGLGLDRARVARGMSVPDFVAVVRER